MPSTIQPGAHIGIHLTNDPAASPLTFVDLGYVAEQSLSEEPMIESREIFAPSPGRLVRKDVIQTIHQSDFTFTLQQVSAETWQSLFRLVALPPAGGGVQIISEQASDSQKGFIEIKTYDQIDALMTTIVRFCYIEPQSLAYNGRDVLSPSFRCLTLDSAQNTFQADYLQTP